MSIDSAQAGGSPDASPAATAVVSPAAPNWPWRRAALFSASATQPITIPALVGADPVPATWSSLLLAVAPALLAVAATLAPAPVNLLAAVPRLAVPVVGIVAQVTHTGLFFVPALAVLAGGAVKLWREQPQGREKV